MIAFIQRQTDSIIAFQYLFKSQNWLYQSLSQANTYNNYRSNYEIKLMTIMNAFSSESLFHVNSLGSAQIKATAKIKSISKA